jgi:hypothetical protein
LLVLVVTDELREHRYVVVECALAGFGEREPRAGPLDFVSLGDLYVAGAFEVRRVLGQQRVADLDRVAQGANSYAQVVRQLSKR